MRRTPILDDSIREPIGDRFGYCTEWYTVPDTRAQSLMMDDRASARVAGLAFHGNRAHAR